VLEMSLPGLASERAEAMELKGHLVLGFNLQHYLASSDHSDRMLLRHLDRAAVGWEVDTAVVAVVAVGHLALIGPEVMAAHHKA
jgi:hypothetical protein